MKISVIICAYNEEETIKNVITTVSDYFFDEVIVVNDGSSDKTDEIVSNLTDKHSFKYISYPENKGKGYAMATGIESASGELIVFIDADLSNFKAKHFFQLINPLLKKQADMVLGQATETLINDNINPFKSLSGQRALLKKDVLPIINKMKQSRFGVETLINLYYQSEGKKTKYVSLRGLKHPTKFNKTTKKEATKEFMKEGKEIAITAYKNIDLITNSLKNKLKLQ